LEKIPFILFIVVFGFAQSGTSDNDGSLDEEQELIKVLNMSTNNNL
tara:strand:- start:621 stop:758 length:138 start_codon:yes stop_codon:yes gene_type:complete